MSDKTRFKKNQVVWAKVKGYPWWPSVIAQIKSQDSGNEQILVNFLNEESHSTLPKDKVQDFLENYENMAKQYQQQKKKKLQEAVEMAMRIAKGNSSFDDEKSKYVKKYKKRAAQSSESSEAESSDDEGDDEQKSKAKKVGRKPGRKPKGKKGKITQKQQSKSRQQSKNRSKGDKSDDEEDENSQDESSSEEQTQQNETSQSKNNNNSKEQKQIQKKMESSTLSQKEENKDSITKMSDNQNKEEEPNIKNKQDKNSEQIEKSDQKQANQNSEQSNQIDEIEEESKTQVGKNNKVGGQKIPEKPLQRNVEPNQKVDKNQKQNCENTKEVQKEVEDEDGDDEDEDENENTDTQWSKKSQKQNHENQSDNTESKRVTRSKINNNNNSNQNQSENKKKLSISSIKVASKQDKFKSTPSKQSELEEQEEQSTNQEQQMDEEENTQNNENSSKKQNNNTLNNNLNKNNQAHDEQDQKENNINSNNGNVQHNNNNISNNLIYNTRSNRSPNLTYNQNNLKNKNGLKLLNLGKQQLKPHKYNTRTESGKSTPSEKLVNGILPYKKQKLENGEELQQDISPSYLQQNHDLKEEVDNLNFMVNYNELDFDQQQLNLDRITKYVKKLQNFLKEFDQKLVKNIEKVKEQQNNNDKNIDNTQYKQLENITLIKKLDKLCLDFQNLQDIHEYINFQQSSIGKIFNSLLNIFTIYKTSQPLEINVKEKLTQIVKQIKIITVDQTLNINQFKQNINIFSHFQTELDMLLSEQQKSSSENNSDHLHENEQFETPKKHQSLNNQQQQINQQNNYINGKSSTSSVITQNTNNIILNGEKQNNQHSHQIDDQQLQQDEKIKKMRKKVCIKILECLTQKHEGNKKQSQNMALSIEKLIKQTDPLIDKTYRHMAKKTLKILSNGFKHQVDSLLNCLNDKENSTQFVDLVNNF